MDELRCERCGQKGLLYGVVFQEPSYDFEGNSNSVEFSVCEECVQKVSEFLNGAEI